MAAYLIAVTMPKWGIEMTEGTINGWRVVEGQRVERGAEILDVETEKIVNAVEAPATGVLRRILTTDGETHAVGALIGVIAGGQASEADISSFVESFVAAVVSFDPDAPVAAHQPAKSDAAAGARAAAGAVPVESAASTAVATVAGPGPGVDIESGAAQGSLADEGRVSPIARRIAERLRVDLSKVSGTGRNGRISKEDVENYARQSTSADAAAKAPAPALAPASAQAVAAAAVVTTAATVPAASPAMAAGPLSSAVVPVSHRVVMSARRITIAHRLLEAKQTIPHYRLDIDVDLGALQLHRRALREGTADRITVNDLLLRAAALALVQHPMVNAQLAGDEILQFDNADIAIAVAADAGLVTPILRSANLKTVAQIAKESRELIGRAQAGTLRREEISGGSFTISNLGMYGVTRFDAIINPPQVAILAVGAAGQRAVVRGDALAVAEVVTLTLSADHRVVDGAVGAAFLSTLRGLLERPAGL